MKVLILIGPSTADIVATNPLRENIIIDEEPFYLVFRVSENFNQSSLSFSSNADIICENRAGALKKLKSHSLELCRNTLHDTLKDDVDLLREERDYNIKQIIDS